MAVIAVKRSFAGLSPQLWKMARRRLVLGRSLMASSPMMSFMFFLGGKQMLIEFSFHVRGVEGLQGALRN